MNFKDEDRVYFRSYTYKVLEIVKDSNSKGIMSFVPVCVII